MVLSSNLAMAMSAPVLPAETATSASPFLTASMASHIEDFQRPLRSAWLGLSSILIATSVWTTRDSRLEPRPRVEQRLDHRAVAEQQELDVGMAPERQFGARHDHRCPMVSPHGVERDADFLGHGATIPRRRETQQGAQNHPCLPPCPFSCPFFSAASAAKG